MITYYRGGEMPRGIFVTQGGGIKMKKPLFIMSILVLMTFIYTVAASILSVCLTKELFDESNIDLR